MTPDELELLILTVPPLQLYAGPDGNYPLELQALMLLRLGRMPTMAALRYWLPKLYAADLSEEARFHRWELLVEAVIRRECQPVCGVCKGLLANVRDRNVWDAYPVALPGHTYGIRAIGAGYSQLWDGMCIYGATTLFAMSSALMSLNTSDVRAFDRVIRKVLEVKHDPR